MSAKAIEYNRYQAEQYGWSPQWFGCVDFNLDLVNAIKVFQRENGLTADGMCGPGTYRKKFAEIDQTGDFVLDHGIQSGDKYIVHAGEATEIFWDKVVLWTEAEKFAAKPGSYKDMSSQPQRKPNMFITHWDVCLSSSSCAKVLSQRNLSVHYLIDNDSSIIQCLDSQHVAYHASGVNSVSIGVEVSCAYDLKWQSWYESKGYGSRPIWKDKVVHGRTLDPFLGFYDKQVQALAALWEAVSWATGIPLQLPDVSNTVDPKVANGTARCFANHYHVTAKKIDSAGLNNEYVLSKALELRTKRIKLQDAIS